MIRTLYVKGYRSVRELTLELSRITTLTGPNGCGKSNLYNAMLLIHRAAEGSFARVLAGEGGMASALWAGPLKQKKERKRIVLRIDTSDFRYELAVGLPSMTIGMASPFDGNQPDIKEEFISLSGKRRPSTTFLERKGHSVVAKDLDGNKVVYPFEVEGTESVLAQLREPHRYPELSRLREEIRGWRSYHHFRTDPDAALRHPQVGIRTPVLSNDGADLAAALQTIDEIGDAEQMRDIIRRVFGGAELNIGHTGGRFSISLSMPGLFRPLSARELSDGTLRFLCLIAALLSPRPPSVLALNEPETSIHPDLIDPLAELITTASKHSQMWITTHSARLAAQIEHYSKEPAVELALENSMTVAVGPN